MNSSASGRRAARPFLVLAAVFLSAASGCGPGKASISGTVKFNGQPLPSGTIAFLSEAGDRQVTSANIADGKYSIPSIQPGPAKVTVVTMPPNTHPGAAPAGAAAPPPVAPGKYVPIPLKYANPDQSGLSYEVKGGDQTKDFDLSP